MTFDERLQLLTGRARMETPPVVDVADHVILMLTDSPSLPVWTAERPLMWLAGFSSVVAVAVLVVAFTWYGTVDPLKEVVETVSWVIQ